MDGLKTLYTDRHFKKATNNQQMEETPNQAMHNGNLNVVLQEDKLFPAVVPTGSGVVSAMKQFELYKRGELINNPDQEEEDISRIEFVLYKSYWICNVKLKGTWRHCSYPASTTVGEFLLSGSMANAKDWSYGRKENNL